MTHASPASSIVTPPSPALPSHARSAGYKDIVEWLEARMSEKPRPKVIGLTLDYTAA